MKLFEALDVIDDCEARSAAMQMALDEALLTTATVPILRFYRWSKPAVSFGYFSRFADVEAYAPARELVRRWTGGGIVLHGADLTYSLAVPRNHSVWSASPQQIYTQMHTVIQSALRMLGVAATLAADSAARVSDACFANPVRADLMLNGEKIAGAAQRKSRLGLLQQGSIQIATLPSEFRELLASKLSRAHRRITIARALEQSASELAVQKYASAAWLMRR